MKKLSEHFTLEEMTHSNTAVALGIPNEPDEIIEENLRQLCVQVLEPLREYMGKPLHINSGYRCPQVNAAVGGSKTSQHMKGQAADVAANNLKDARKMLEFVAAECRFDQCFVETNGKTYWLHVSYVSTIEKNRQRILLMQKKY